MQRFARLILLCVVVVAACGGGDDDEDVRDSSSSSADRTTTTELESEPTDTTTTTADLGLQSPPGSPDREPFGEFGETAIAIEAPDGTIVGWCVLLADVPELRQRGLMEVTDLQGYTGMLFVWDEDSQSSFYMRNTPMPLSIAWFEVDGDFVSSADMEPCPDVENCALYPAGGSYRYALEVPQGELDAMGVGEGSRLRVGGECAPRSGET